MVARFDLRAFASFIPLALLFASVSCGSSGDDSDAVGTGGAASMSEGGAPALGGVTSSGGSAHAAGGAPSAGASGVAGSPPLTSDGPLAGYSDGHAAIPDAAQLEDVSSPTSVIGTGTPASCTADAFVAAVAKGGIITFDCGPDPVTISMTQPAKVFNDKGTKLLGADPISRTRAGASKLPESGTWQSTESSTQKSSSETRSV